MAELETDIDSASEKAPSRSWRVWIVLSMTTALVSCVETFYTNTWWNLLGRKFWLIDLVSTLTLPLWMLMTFMALLRFPSARNKLWWLLIPAPQVFLPILQYLFVMFAWGTRGFAP